MICIRKQKKNSKWNNKLQSYKVKEQKKVVKNENKKVMYWRLKLSDPWRAKMGELNFVFELNEWIDSVRRSGSHLRLNNSYTKRFYASDVAEKRDEYRFSEAEL